MAPNVSTTAPPQNSTSHAKTFSDRVAAFFHMKASLVYLIFAAVLLVLLLICCCCCCRCCKKCRKKGRKRRSPGPFTGGADGMGDDDDEDVKGFPRLAYSLEYVTNTRVLRVNCVGAFDLPGKEKEMNAYLRLSTNPQTFGQETYVDRSTKVITHNKDPAWGEIFSYPMSRDALKRRSLVFSVLNHDKGSVDKPVGSAVVELDELKSPEYFDKRYNRTVRLDLSAEDGPLYGEICLAIRYERRTTAYELSVTVIEARHLPVRLDHNSECFVCLSFFVNDQRVTHKRTDKRTLTRNPYFNETFKFWTDLATEILSSSILVKVDIKKGLLRKKCIGEIRIGKDIGNKEQRHFWETVLGNPRHQYARWYPLLPPKST